MSSTVPPDQRPLRILQVVGAMNRGGIESWLMHVLRHIDRSQFQIDFLVHTNEQCHFTPEIRALGSQIFACPHTTNPLRYAPGLLRILRQHGPYDVIHSHVHFFNGVVVLLAHMAGVPVRISHSHTDTSSLWARASLARRSYILLMQRWLHKHATCGVAVSRKAANAQFGPDWQADPRFQVMYCGIDLSPYQASLDHAAVRDSLGIPQDALVIGHVGRFIDIKNHAFLVDIADEVARRHPNTYLLMVGDGPLRADIEQRAAAAGLGERSRIGPQPDVPSLARAVMDVFVMPSRYEGLPIVGMEAQAAGLPMVLSDIITTELDIIHPLIQRLSVAQPATTWADAVLAAYANAPARAQGEALRLMEQSPFNIHTNITSLEQLYRKLVASSHPVGTEVLAHT